MNFVAMEPIKVLKEAALKILQELQRPESIMVPQENHKYVETSSKDDIAANEVGIDGHEDIPMEFASVDDIVLSNGELERMNIINTFRNPSPPPHLDVNLSLSDISSGSFQSVDNLDVHMLETSSQHGLELEELSLVSSVANSDDFAPLLTAKIEQLQPESMSKETFSFEGIKNKLQFTMRGKEEGRRSPDDTKVIRFVSQIAPRFQTNAITSEILADQAIFPKLNNVSPTSEHSQTESKGNASFFYEEFNCKEEVSDSLQGLIDRKQLKIKYEKLEMEKTISVESTIETETEPKENSPKERNEVEIKTEHSSENSPKEWNEQDIKAENSSENLLKEGKEEDIEAEFSSENSPKETNEEDNEAEHSFENNTKGIREEDSSENSPKQRNEQDDDAEEQTEQVNDVVENDEMWAAPLKNCTDIFDRIPIPSLIPLNINQQFDPPEQMPELIPITQQLPEEKVQIDENLPHIDQDQVIKEESTTKVKKIPLIGSVRKGKRRAARPTKPPWLKSATNDKVANLSASETTSAVVKDEETSSAPVVDASNENEDKNEMREKLFSQLQMLKVKRKCEPLVSTSAMIQSCSNVYYEKRSVKPLILSPENEDASAPFGIQIVAVAGGVDIDNCKDLVPVEPPCNDNVDDIEMEEESEGHSDQAAKEVIINEHLDSPTIKLTKTKDYKKIKGWNRKKLLAKGNKDKADAEELTIIVESTPGCSYSSDETLNNVVEADVELDEDDTEVQQTNVFASNNLEGFLQEKDLNISYNVPNLKSSNQNINLLDNCVLVDINQENRRKSIDIEDSNSSSSFKEYVKESPKLDAPKPRTLAEKRKMMQDGTDRELRCHTQSAAKRQRMLKYRKRSSIETANEEDDLLVPLKSHTAMQTLRLQQHSLDDKNVKFLTEAQSKPKKTVISQVKFRGRFRGQIGPYNVVSRKRFNRNYWWRYADVPRKSSIEYIPKERVKKRKVSILKTQSNVEYKPGPLSKKDQLQTKGQSRWKTIVTNLPQVNVIVQPEVGKMLHPAIRPFVQFNSVKVSEERANFAISMVRHKNFVDEELTMFTFPAHYERHQEKILLRQFVGPKNISRSEYRRHMPETNQESMRSIENVVDQMLDYVELKTEEDCLIKDDPTLREYLKDVHYDDIAEKDSKSVTGKDLRTKTNQSAELKRLNVLVVDMPKEPTPQIEDCKKEFCQLGCVCQSIANKCPTAEHCGEPKCMLQCVCGFELSHRPMKERQQPELNEKTISRLQKEAKKNITAREERDFTLTAIRSADNTFIFNRARRTPKYNYKKYEGFHVNFLTEEMRKLHYDPKISQCSVDLIQCDFSDVVPFCLVHDLYDCHCKGLATFNLFEQCQIDRLGLLTNLLMHENKLTTPAIKSTSCVVAGGANVNNDCTTKSRNTSDDYIRSYAAGNSARLRGTGVYYQSRNQTNTYKIKMARKLKYDKTVDQEIVNQWYILPPHAAIPVSDQKRQILANARRRKQELKIRTISEINMSIENSTMTDAERLKEAMRTPVVTQVAENVPKTTVKVVGDTLRTIANTLAVSGALYAPTASISAKFAQMVGNRQDDSEFRLLLWPSLSLLYRVDDIQIWYNSTNDKLRFVVTDSRTTPKDGYENINVFKGGKTEDIKADFIKWIVTDKLPANKQPENILVILKMNECYWEICGICAKSPAAEKYAQARNQILEKHRQAVEERHLGNDQPAPKRQLPVKSSEEITPVDAKYYKCSQQVHFCHGIFGSKSLTLSDMNDTRVDAEAEIIVALPRVVRTSRWRVLKINSSFAILAFANRSFNIKCSDILKVMANAAKNGRAIIIKSPECFVGYAAKAFGIYVAPNFTDRIFLGPFGMNEEHRIETLRFVNNKLIHLEVFNAMRGHKNIACTGVWYTQQATPVLSKSDSVIDLTEMDEVMDRVPSPEINITEEMSVETSTERNDSEEPIEIVINDGSATCNRNNGLSTQAVISTNTFVRPRKRPMEDTNNSFKLPKLPRQKMYVKNVAELNSEVKKSNENSVAGFKAKLQLDMTTIIQQAKCANAEDLEKLFKMRFRKLMQRMKLPIPSDADPVCFRMNFGNGVILGYHSKNMVHVVWPGAEMPRLKFVYIEHAVIWLQRELSGVFITIPSKFKVTVSVVGPAHYREYIERNVISSKYFRDICIIGEFGIMRLGEAQPYLILANKKAAQMKLDECKRSAKFRKAINTIRERMDMSAKQLSKRVNNLVKRAKAAADRQVQLSVVKTATKKRHSLPSILVKQNHVQNDSSQVVQLPPNQLISVGNDLMPLVSVVKNSGVAPSANVKSVHTKMRLSDVRALAQPVPRLTPIGSTKENVMRIDLTHMNLADAKKLIKRMYGVNIKALAKLPDKPTDNNNDESPPVEHAPEESDCMLEQ